MLEVLQELHSTVAKKLLERIQSGEATAADFGAAIKFLKDNGIDSVPEANKDLQSLASQMPTFEDEDEAVVLPFKK